MLNHGACNPGKRSSTNSTAPVVRFLFSRCSGHSGRIVSVPEPRMWGLHVDRDGTERMCCDEDVALYYDWNASRHAGIVAGWGRVRSDEIESADGLHADFFLKARTLQVFEQNCLSPLASSLRNQRPQEGAGQQAQRMRPVTSSASLCQRAVRRVAGR